MQKTAVIRWKMRFHLNRRQSASHPHALNPNFKSKKTNSGQALLEYTLLLSLAAGLAMAINGGFVRLIGTGITSFNAVLENELTTGNFPENTNPGGQGFFWTQQGE